VKPKLAFDPGAWDEYLFWVAQDKKVANRINRLLEEVLRTPRSGSGKPEQLKGFSQEVWSRRITLEHRLVYVLQDDLVIVQSCRFHY
jgi:toxin YoeB